MLNIVLVGLVLAGTAFGQAQQANNGWRRVLDNERYFYNGIDAKIEQGWTDERSLGVNTTYRFVLPPAQGLARLQFQAANADWKISTKGAGYPAKPEDQIIFRIRGEEEETPLVFYASPTETLEPIVFKFKATPLWRLVHVPLTALGNAAPLKTVGIRNDSGRSATIYVAYMYLQVHP